MKSEAKTKSDTAKRKAKREHREKREAGAGVAGALPEQPCARSPAPRASARAEDAKLDADIGVSGGELGAPNLRHPPAEVGAYSGSSAGSGDSDSEEPAEGPIEPPPD